MSRHVSVQVGVLLTVAIGAFLAAGCEKSPLPPTTQTTGTRPSESSADPTPAAAPAESVAATEDSRSSRPAPEPAAKFVAYYFHRTMRCPTCLSIEKQAREAIETGFADELEDGTVTWQAVNIEESGNEHFEKDFELTSSSLVLVEMAADEVGRWKNLERVWELVDDSFGFQEYVWTELAEFLES